MILAFILSATTYCLYGFTTLSPVLWSSSPFRTPLTPVLQRIGRRCVDSPIGRIIGIIIYLVAIATIFGLTTVHGVARSVVTCYTLAVRMPRWCVDFLVGEVLAPTTVALHSLAIAMTLCLLAVHAVMRSIVALFSLAIDTAFKYFMAVQGGTRSVYSQAIDKIYMHYGTVEDAVTHSSFLLFCDTLHWLARGILSHQRRSPLLVDPWITQTVFSDRVAASALSWLGLNAETTDIYHAVLYGLGDTVRGVTVADDLALPLKERISVQTLDLVSDRTSGTLRTVVTHLRAAYHLRSLLPSRDVTTWVHYQVSDVKWGEAKLRTPRDYDTLLRVSTILEKDKEKKGMYRELARFFGSRAGQEACASPSSILPSTALAIAQLFIDASEYGVLKDFRGHVLAMLYALRSHFVVSPDLAAKILKASLADEKGTIKAEGQLTAKPRHDCGRASCEAMTYLIAILARHDFDDSTRFPSVEVKRSLKTQTFETFALFCREFPPAKSCTDHEFNLTTWLSGNEPFSQISLCGRDIVSFMPYCKSLSRDTRICLLRHLLHPDQSWCAPDSSDPDRDEVLDACLKFLSDIYGDRDFDISEVRILLDDACLEPLQRAPRWNGYSLLRKCAAVLASAGDHGSDDRDLVLKFIFCEAKGGPDGTSTRKWDLVLAGSQMILADAQSAYEGDLRLLCQAVGTLRQRYPDKGRWKEMGERVRLGAGFLNESTWRARTDDAVHIQHTLEKFWEVMDDEDPFAGLEMNTALLRATDEPQSVGATSQNFIEWQVDGAY